MSRVSTPAVTLYSEESEDMVAANMAAIISPITPSGSSSRHMLT